MNIKIEGRFLTAFFCLAAIFLFAGKYEACAQDRLKLNTVVLDAGHGGKDPGCVSRDGKTYEKNITLDLALRLGSRIKEEFPDIKVVYTRSKDVYLTLDERANTANSNKANLFLSIHVNASDATAANGFSSHILGQSSKKGRDTFQGNLNVCRRENSVILLEDDYSTKYEGFNPEDPESFIFFNLMQNAFYEQSLSFAALINEKMDKLGPVANNRGISQDPFYVLWKTTMPAVLFEMAFISNKEDLLILRSEEKLDKIADALFHAFVKFKENYDNSLDYIPETTEKEENVQEVSHTETIKPEIAKENIAEYGIQISTSSRKLPLNDPFFKKHPAYTYSRNGMYIYVVEQCGDYEKTEEIFRVVSKEFPGSFIVRIEDGFPKRFRK